MAQIALKGHDTRGKEVIEILEMLGGENTYQFFGDDDDAVYSVEGHEIVIYELEYVKSNDFIVFTLEEFLEYFPYKVGDKVKVLVNGYCGAFDIQYMAWNCVSKVVKYNILGYWLSAENLQPYKEENMEENFGECIEKTIQECLFGKEENMEEKLMPRIDIAGYSKDKYIIDLGNYEIKQENGKTYAVRKQPKYPQTCEECLKVLSKTMNGLDSMTGYKFGALMHLQQLLICRDAYWKIAGEQMGLGKPWEPDYTNPDIDLYVIINIHNNIEKAKYGYGFQNCVLSFPTEEMRDAFYENFKELIEQCKMIL